MSVHPSKAIFVSHGGGPLPLLNSPEHKGLIQMLRDCSTALEDAKGIILFSAHWETSTVHISAGSRPGLFYGYENMKDELPRGSFDFQFPARGNPILAREIAETLETAGFGPVLDTERGWDEGVFVPMTLMRPEMDIPIVEMSVLIGDSEADTTQKNLVLGKAMRSFVDRGYTVVGSGSSSHDFNAIRAAVVAGKNLDSETWAFESAMVAAAAIVDAEEREQKLVEWRSWPSSHAAHLDGHVEHFMPFVVAAACVGDTAGRRIGICDIAGTPSSAFSWA